MLSITIPILNESEAIEETIVAVLKNLSGETETEILLVDGGSEDGTIEKIQFLVSKFKKLKILFQFVFFILQKVVQNR